MAGEKKQILDLLIPLHRKQQILFGIICVKRVLSLYTLFDKEYDISEQNKSLSKGEGYNALLSVLDFIENKMEQSTEEDIKNIINTNENLIPDSDLFDLNTKVYMAQLIAQSVLNILRFSLTNDINKILFCTEANLEIINQIKTDQYYTLTEINVSTTEKEFLDSAFAKEIETERECIDIIRKNKGKNHIDIFIVEHIIKWWR